MQMNIAEAKARLSELIAAVERGEDVVIALGVNMSRVAEEAIAQAVKLKRNRFWAQENRDALDAYAREGVALARYRTF